MKKLNLQIDDVFARRLVEKAKADGRSPARYVLSVVGRDLFGPDYSDLEIIIPHGRGRGTLQRAKNEGDAEFEARQKSIKQLL